MTTVNNEAMTQNLNQIKAEGGRRTQKISKIFKAALGEVATEVKEGTTTIRPLAQELAGEALNAAKTKGQAVNTNVRQALQDTTIDQDKDLIERLTLQLQAIIQAIRETLFTHKAEAVAETAPQLESEIAPNNDTVITLDAVADAA